MVTVLILAILVVLSWRAPKAFAWLLIGPIIGIPLGGILWTIAIQFDDRLFNLRSAGAFVVVTSIMAGFLFARGE